MKIWKRTVVLALALGLALTAFAGCKKNSPVTDDRGVTVDGNKVYKGEYAGKSLIRVDFFDVGYGKDWIYEQAKDFVYENEEYAFVLNADSSLVSNFEQKLTSGRNVSDIYIAPNTDWQSFAADGTLAPIDSVYSAKPDGEDGDTVHDKLVGMYKDAGAFEKNGESHYYVMPWTQMTTGIAYNAKLFEEYELSVPKTMAEFEDVCDAIIEKSGGKVAPFVVPGKIDGYFDFIVMNWWIQYSGLDKVREFFAYGDVNVFDYTDPSKPYYGYKVALEEFNKYFGKNAGLSKYVLAGSGAKDAYTAQSDFINGRAAMTINANWLENEMKTLVEETGFEMKLMSVPFIEGAQKEGDEYVSVNYASAGFDFMSVPAAAKNIEGAKKFLAFMCRDDQLKSFTKNTMGTVRPFDYDYASLRGELSGFAGSVMDIIAGSSETYFDYATGPRRYKASRNIMYMPTHSIFFDGTSVTDMLKTEFETAKQYWDDPDYWGV